MPGGTKKNRLARYLKLLRGLGWRRVAATLALLALGILLARLTWSLPVFNQAENWMYDARSHVTAKMVGQDPRVTMVVYDDQTLIDARKRSPLDRGLLQRALANIDKMEPKAIGIDILFDQPQDEDDALVAQLRSMKTPTFVGYADAKANKDDVVWEQQQYLDAFMARLEGSSSQKASVQLDNSNGVTRVWPTPGKNLPEPLARAMLKGAKEPAVKQFEDYRGSIRYRLAARDDEPLFSFLRIDLFADPAIAAALTEQIKGRYILIGGDLVDADRVETPLTLTSASGESIPGIQVHAELIAQMLDHGVEPRLSNGSLWAIAVLIAFAATLTAMLEAGWLKLIPLVIAQIATFIGIPFLLASRGFDTQQLPAVGWIIGWAVCYFAVDTAVRAHGATQRKFAQSALGKYLPRDIAQQIIDNPDLMNLYGTKQNLFILFSDLEGFTQLSHKLEPEMVATLLNRYLETLSQVVLDHGGVIDKFVGDAVVAFWGAPIARPDDGAQAAACGYAMWQAGEDFRKSVDPAIAVVGRTRVGMHWGEAIVGNFGGERRIQYTALGDAMNTAARLESANKSLGTSVIASGEFAERSGRDDWRPLGQVVLRGRSKPVEIFEPAPQLTPENRRALADALTMYNKNTISGLAAIREIASNAPDDPALKKLVERLETSDGVSPYALS